jgi:hypothetical protein
LAIGGCRFSNHIEKLSLGLRCRIGFEHAGFARLQFRHRFLQHGLFTGDGGRQLPAARQLAFRGRYGIGGPDDGRGATVAVIEPQTKKGQDKRRTDHAELDAFFPPEGHGRFSRVVWI